MQLFPANNTLNIDHIYICLCASIPVYVYTTSTFIFILKNSLDLQKNYKNSKKSVASSNANIL